MKAPGAKPGKIDLHTEGTFETIITVSKEGKITSAELVDTRATMIGRLFLEAINNYSNDWKSATLRGDPIDDTLIYTFNLDLRSSEQKFLNKFLTPRNLGKFLKLAYMPNSLWYMR